MKLDNYLHSILTFSESRDESISHYLSEFDTSFEFELTYDILVTVLTKFVDGKIDAYDLEEWANFVDCRDEILLGKFEDYIYALSNPGIMNGDDMSNDKIRMSSKLERSKIKCLLDCLLVDKDTFH